MKGGASFAEWVRRYSARASSSSLAGPPVPVTRAHISSTLASTMSSGSLNNPRAASAPARLQRGAAA